jgi:hypothetical protein
LPVWSHMDEETAMKICRAVERIHLHAAEVTKLLNQSTMASAT